MFKGKERLVNTLRLNNDSNDGSSLSKYNISFIYVLSQMLISPTRMVSQFDSSLHSGGMALAEGFARLDEKALAFEVLLAQLKKNKVKVIIRSSKSKESRKEETTAEREVADYFV